MYVRIATYIFTNCAGIALDTVYTLVISMSNHVPQSCCLLRLMQAVLFSCGSGYLAISLLNYVAPRAQLATRSRASNKLSLIKLHSQCMLDETPLPIALQTDRINLFYYG